MTKKFLQRFDYKYDRHNILSYRSFSKMSWWTRLKHQRIRGRFKTPPKRFLQIIFRMGTYG